jgi:ubiquinone/menaquinone biosynthesis C-methylase UbiE
VNDTYYRDHWVDIEPDRFERYTQMFGWSESSRPLLEPAAIQPGETVVDLGCGPGFTVMEVAKWVGPHGQVHGVEVNSDFVEFGRRAAVERNLEDVVSFHHVASSRLPFENESIDCVLAKNVLVYVDDLQETFREGHRILKRGGRFHAVEGDWGLAIAEPIPEDEWRALVAAASIAFRTPTAGRRLYGVARAAGFSNVEVSVVCRPDTTGRLLPMVRNLCAYAKKSRGLDDQRIASVLAACEEAADRQELLVLNPQFLVTAIR